MTERERLFAEKLLRLIREPEILSCPDYWECWPDHPYEGPNGERSYWYLEDLEKLVGPIGRWQDATPALASHLLSKWWGYAENVAVRPLEARSPRNDLLDWYEVAEGLQIWLAEHGIDPVPVAQLAAAVQGFRDGDEGVTRAQIDRLSRVVYATVMQVGRLEDMADEQAAEELADPPLSLEPSLSSLRNHATPSVKELAAGYEVLLSKNQGVWFTLEELSDASGVAFGTVRRNSKEWQEVGILVKAPPGGRGFRVGLS